eukprot:6172392-Pleurochrysis_carterae.AAC.1
MAAAPPFASGHAGACVVQCASNRSRKCQDNLGPQTNASVHLSSWQNLAASAQFNVLSLHDRVPRLSRLEILRTTACTVRTQTL